MFYIGIRKIGQHEYYAGFNYDLYQQMGKIIIEILYTRTEQNLQLITRGIPPTLTTGTIPNAKIFTPQSDRRKIIQKPSTETTATYKELSAEEISTIEEIIEQKIQKLEKILNS